MTQIIACTDASICTAEDGLHGGIGIALYEGQVLVHDISEHKRIAKNDPNALEYYAIRRALDEIARRPEYQNTTILICSDNEQAVRRWQEAANGSCIQRPKVLKKLAAKSLTVVFTRVPGKEIRRAHCLAKYVALSQISTVQAENTRRQLLKAMER